jgi:hypothetical protein
MTTKGYPSVPDSLPNQKEHLRQIAVRLNDVSAGKVNATIDQTLRNGQTTTTLTDPRIYATSILWASPLTANAAAIAASVWFSAQIKGSATINHSSTGNTDQKFRIGIIGG